MFRFGRLVASVVLGAILVTPAFAYDVDTHFYATNMMARWAGIAPEVADQLAACNAWIDVSAWTTPMAFVGPRRLFHFPADRRAFSGETHGKKTNYVTEASPNHPVASILISEGLNDGDLLKACAGLHVLMDSYGHAGFTAELGHMEFGHWPDRPWTEPEKYEDMVKTFFKALVAIRRRLPEEALNKNFKGDGKVANVDLDAEQLANQYLANQDVQGLVRNDVMRDPRYTKLAVTHILKKEQDGKFISASMDLRKLIKPEYFEQKLTTREILAKVIADGMALEDQTGQKIFDRDAIARWILPGVPIEHAKGGIENPDVINRLVHVMTQAETPEDFSDIHKVEFEKQNIIRTKEMAIRTGDWRDLIEKYFGERPTFDPRKLSDVVGRALKVVKTHRKKALDPDFLLTIAEKTRNKGTLVSLDFKNRIKWMVMMAKYWLVDDVILKKHVVGDPDGLKYQYEHLLSDEELKELIENSKPLLSADQLAEMKAVRRRINTQEGDKPSCTMLWKLF